MFHTYLLCHSLTQPGLTNSSCMLLYTDGPSFTRSRYTARSVTGLRPSGMCDGRRSYIIRVTKG